MPRPTENKAEDKVDWRTLYDLPNLTGTSQELIEACWEKREEDVLRILGTEAGRAAFEECNQDKSTILHLACRQNLALVVEAILNHEEGRRLLTKKIAHHGQLPMHIACLNGSENVVRVLLKWEQARRTMEEATEIGRYPLHWAATNDHSNVMQVLLETEEGRRTIGCGDKDGVTPLLYAAIDGYVKVVRVLLHTEEGMAAVSQKATTFLMTPLYCAAAKGRITVVRALLETEKGRSTIAMKDKHGVTPLCFAAGAGNAREVRELLQTPEGRATIEEKENFGGTPLWMAAKNGQTDVINVLLDTEEGRRTINIKNDAGKSPMDMAQEGGHICAMFMLDNYSSNDISSDPRLGCGVCRKPFSSTDSSLMPMVVCGNGHSFCRRCIKAKWSLCPMCHVACVPSPIVNRALCDAIEVLSTLVSKLKTGELTK